MYIMLKKIFTILAVCFVGGCLIFLAGKFAFINANVDLTRATHLTGQVVSVFKTTRSTRYGPHPISAFRLDSYKDLLGVTRPGLDFDEFKRLIAIGDTITVIFRPSSKTSSGAHVNLDVYQIEKGGTIVLDYKEYRRNYVFLSVFLALTGLFIIAFGVTQALKDARGRGRTNLSIMRSLSLFLVVTTLMSCGNAGRKKPADTMATLAQTCNEMSHVAVPRLDSGVMRTGLYYVVGSVLGVKIEMRGTREVYYLSDKPFVSVEDLCSSELLVNNFSGRPVTDLCLKFNAKGTSELERGTGNLAHPKIAIVVAGQLLAVGDNPEKTTSGSICVSLVEISQSERLEMKAAVDRKY